jgi:hypothetical protein
MGALCSPAPVALRSKQAVAPHEAEHALSRDVHVVHAAEIGTHLAVALTAKGRLGEDLSDEGDELVVCDLARRSGTTRWLSS